MAWFVYILRCADNTLYTGATTDPLRRLAQHNAGTAARYTRVRTPVSLRYVETAPDRSAALVREAAIKKLSRTAKLALIAKARPGSAESICELESGAIRLNSQRLRTHS